MKKSNFKRNFMYGLVVIIPLGIIGLIVMQLLAFAKSFEALVGMDTGDNVWARTLLALLLLIAICYAIGALVRTRIGSLSFERIERKLLQHVPFYKIISNILKGFAEADMAYPPVLAQLSAPGAAVLGVVVEENANNTLTVFVPTSPAMTIGNLHILSRDRVTYLDASTLDLVNCVTEWGIGSGKLIGTAGIEQQPWNPTDNS